LLPAADARARGILYNGGRPEDAMTTRPPAPALPLPPRLLLGLILLLAAGLRVAAAMNDLWLDELISLSMASHLKSPLDLFTTFNNDNNHHLNTLYLSFIGEGHAAIVYRLLSLVCGVATVAAAYWATDRRRPVTRLLAALLVAVNYPLIHYSSEARGYAGAVLAAVLAYGVADRWVRRPTWGRAGLFAAAFGLGVFSHLTFCFIWGAIGLWTLAAAVDRRKAAPGVKDWVILHAGPAALLGIFYLACLRKMAILGGPQSPIGGVIRQFLANVLGWPLTDSASAWLVAGGVGALAAWGMAARGSPARRERRWIFFAATMIPLAVLVVTQPKFVYARYLLVTAPFFCLMVAFAVARVGRSKAGVGVAAAVVTALVVGQGVLVARFLRVGRGNLSAAARLIGAETAGAEITIAADQTFRGNFEFPYLTWHLPPGKHLQTSPLGEAVAGPEWYVVHGEGGAPPGPSQLRNSQTGSVYARVAFFPCSELAGQAWSVYHRLPAAASGAATR
jgi:hypothetical protein